MKGALANRLQRRTACKIQNGRQGAPKWPPGVWKGVYPWVFGRSKQLSQNKFFDPYTPSMRKGRDEENGEKTGGKIEKRLMKIVATTSLPAVDRPNIDRWNAARSR